MRFAACCALVQETSRLESNIHNKNSLLMVQDDCHCLLMKHEGGQPEECLSSIRGCRGRFVVLSCRKPLKVIEGDKKGRWGVTLHSYLTGTFWCRRSEVVLTCQTLCKQQQWNEHMLSGPYFEVMLCA